MMQSRPAHSLFRLAGLREREVERLTSDMADKAALRERYRNNLKRLEALYQGVGATGACSPALSLNCAQYKQSVMQMAEVHRGDLALHEANMAIAQEALMAAARKHEALNQLLEQRQNEGRHAQAAQEQKHQDDVAAQTWLRGRTWE